MKTGFIPGWWIVAMLIVSSPAGKARAAVANPVAPVQANELSLVPDNTAAFITIRIAALADTLGLKGRLDKLEPISQLKESLGLPFDAIAQCTVVLQTFPTDKFCMILRTSSPYKPSDIATKFAPNAKKTKLHGKTCHVSADRSICFFDKHILILSNSEESLIACLKQAAGKRQDKALADALKLAGPCDLAGWIKASAIPDAISILPRGVESGLFTLDLGAQLTLHTRIVCTDEDAKLWAARTLRTGADLVRMALIAVPAASEISELFPTAMNKDVAQNMQLFPVGLLRQIEKGLQEARIATEDNYVGMFMNAPLDVKALRTEVGRVFRLIEIGATGPVELGRFPFGPGILQTTNGKLVMPSESQLNRHYPQYFPEDPEPTAPTTASPPELLPAPTISASKETAATDTNAAETLSAAQAAIGGCAVCVPKSEKLIECILVICSNPTGAKVYLNRRAVGFTPCEVVVLEKSKYLFQLELSGYRTFAHEEIIQPTSSMISDGDRRFNFELVPLPKAYEVKRRNQTTRIVAVPMGQSRINDFKFRDIAIQYIRETDKQFYDEDIIHFGATTIGNESDQVKEYRIEYWRCAPVDLQKSGGGKLRRAAFEIDGKPTYAFEANGEVKYYVTEGRNVSLCEFLNREVVLGGDVQKRGDVRGAEYMVVYQVKDGLGCKCDCGELPGNVVQAKATEVVSVPPKKSAKLTVANVRRESAMLFVTGDDGKLTFVKRVPGGDAVDLEANIGQRWTAIFSDNPSAETFACEQDKAIWLLRSLPEPISSGMGGGSGQAPR